MFSSLGASYILWQRMEQRIHKPDVFDFKSEPKLASDSIKIYPSMKKVPAVPEGLFNYNGATSFAALETYGMNKLITSAHPQYQIRYTEPSNNDRPGGGTGLKMLINGELSFAQSGRPIKDSEHAKAKERNFTLEQIPVAIDGLVFFVNPKLPVAALNVEQLKDIFEGKITNWKELGGLDLPIVPISQDPEVHVTVSLLLNNGEKLGDQVKIVRDYTTAMQEVATAAGGISFSPASLVRKQDSIRSIGLAKGNSQNYIFPINDRQVNLQALREDSYPITRRMYVIVRHDGTIEEQAGIAYANLLLTKQGQEIIEDAGFVSLY
ncbi:MAG: substrate-binding domain-containing protein [Cyanobacteria bacterium P01_G01_bin.39]